ncbi:uncharacterized protein LOC126738431 [Anthonomus grandis grandis]|uniref:uncharacterized protein LOC126738431 n=1 Tax=Anthonomus grandis grandis TaxID=2921223 RepID=UPI0021661A66|nr:uncharacterized protein LOC126738431 [Anthonomus grandis grandis]
MKHIKDLSGLCRDELVQFINSFDYVFFDIDGVLLLATTPLAGARECIEVFKKLKKQIGFVTNNTISSFEETKSKLAPFGATSHEIVTPVMSVVAYLKKIPDISDIFCIGGHVLRDTLQQAGYNIVNFEEIPLQEDMSSIRKICLDFLENSKNVGAIVVDLDVNFRLIQAEAAILLLNRNPSMPFIVAATDDSGPLTENIQFIGNQFYVNAIERLGKKECTILAKPSIELKHYLEERFKIPDLNKVLFIGDSLTSDITFANRAGFQSLLVLSGQTKLDDLVNWTHQEENRPDYYIKCLDSFYQLLCQLELC